MYKSVVGGQQGGKFYTICYCASKVCSIKVPFFRTKSIERPEKTDSTARVYVTSTTFPTTVLIALLESSANALLMRTLLSKAIASKKKSSSIKKSNLKRGRATARLCKSNKNVIPLKKLRTSLRLKTKAANRAKAS